ncbi:RuvB-like protein 1 (nucleomorph) [Cryptomonas paramecium]|uniref:RuvB-like helicase n=1 Tax=Cryptomonas paramaecium TaxID=2898 RepID=F2HHB7_9CRYP|nr:RuvB-like protein 1 [Cryptomonas paramecium]AEA38713.1 RuvB-like protein 1 [Cryptomonas paramecium]|mmetsp:Transcript_53480/g.141827  ORF Transcript_53480/g.141827 Transcript_53480/m.141827 type:complete len:418 (-) Transcript_53480:16313-17566(-)
MHQFFNLSYDDLTNRSKNIPIFSFDKRKINPSINLIAEFVKEGKTKNKIILIIGPPGSGKNTTGSILSQKLGKKVPFIITSGYKFSYSNFKKSNHIIQNFRKSIGIRLVDEIFFYEGKLISAKVYDALNLVKINLKTVESNLCIKLFDSLYRKFIKSEIRIGDILYIEPKKSIIKVVNTKRKDFSITEYNFIPNGKVFKKKTIVRDLTLNDFDMINVGFKDQKLSKLSHVSDYLRQEIDKIILKCLQLKKMKILHGVFFIDEAHVLNINNFWFLKKLSNFNFSSTLILSTNRAIFAKLKRLKGVGLFLEFFEKCLIITVKKYTAIEIMNVMLLKFKNNRNVISGNVIKKFKFMIFEKKSINFLFLLSLICVSIYKMLKKQNLCSLIVEFASFLFHSPLECQLIFKSQKNYIITHKIF